jgi:hypothetical protein
MMIQIILCTGLVACLVYAISQRPRAPILSLTIGLIAVAGMALVLAPDLSNRMAHAVGVGRGADLVLYCWVVISLIVSVNLQYRIRDLQAQVTGLARLLAIQSPVSPEHRPGIIGGPPG